MKYSSYQGSHGYENEYQSQENYGASEQIPVHQELLSLHQDGHQEVEMPSMFPDGKYEHGLNYGGKYDSGFDYDRGMGYQVNSSLQMFL